MSKSHVIEIHYAQCRMTRELSPGIVQTHVAWIPEDFAVVGHTVKFRKDGSPWSDGWRIVAAGPPLMDIPHVTALERAHLKQRQASDI
jgi:hypothetical protein